MYCAVSIATNLFDVIITFMFFENFLQWKNDSKKIRAISCMFMFFATLVINQSTMNAVFTILINMCMFCVITYIFFIGMFVKKLLVIIGYCALVMIADIITMLIMLCFFDFNTGTLLHEESVGRAIAMIISKPIILLLTKITCLFGSKSNKRIYTKYWLALMTVPLVNVVLLISMIHFLDYVQTEIITTVYLSAICILYSTTLAFYLFEKIMRVTMLEDRCDMLEKQIIIQEKQQHKNEDENKRFESIRHDIRLHFQCLYNLIKNGYYNEALRHLSASGIIGEDHDFNLHTGNTALDAIMNSKLAEAKQLGIEVHIMCAVPRNIRINEFDICSLFGNLFDNAIEGCMRSRELYKKIDISINYKSNRLSCYMINTATAGTKTEDNRFISSKPDHSRHGIGIHNIEDVILKYNGICKMNHDNNLFEVSITLFGV